MDPEGFCCCGSQDSSEYWESLKNQFEDQSVLLQARELELRHKIAQVEALIATRQSNSCCRIAEETVPKVFPKRFECPVRDVPKPVELKKIACPTSFLQKVMENAKSILTMKCPTIHPSNTINETPTKETDSCICDLEQELCAPSSSKGVSFDSVPTISCSEDCVCNDESTTKNDITGDSYSQEVSNSFSCSCSADASQSRSKKESSSASSSSRSRSTSKNETRNNCSCMNVSTGSNSSKGISKRSLCVSCCTCPSSKLPDIENTSKIPLKEDQSSKSNKCIDPIIKSNKTKVLEGSGSCPCCINCANNVRTEANRVNLRVSPSVPSKPTEVPIIRESGIIVPECKCQYCKDDTSKSNTQKNIPFQKEPERIPDIIRKTPCKEDTCPSMIKLTRSSTGQKISQGKKPEKRKSCCSIGTCQSSKKIRSKVDIKDETVQHGIVESTAPRILNAPRETKSTIVDCCCCIDKDKTQLINMVSDLSTKEQDIKSQLQELLKREKNYDNVFKDFQDMINRPTCCCTSAKEKPTDVQSEIQKVSQELKLENKILKSELMEMKMELKHCLEKIEGPMKYKLVTEKSKCLQLQEELTKASQNMLVNQDTYLREMNSLKLQLCVACSNMTELNTINKRLKDELGALDCMCAKLEEDLLKQKLSEAETIKRLKKRNLDDRNAEDREKESKHDSEQISKESFKCDSNLHVIARKLSKTLKESAPCEQCSKLPAELTGAARCIKDLTDMVESRKTTSAFVDSVDGKKDRFCQSPPPTENEYCQCVQSRDIGAGESKTVATVTTRESAKMIDESATKTIFPAPPTFIDLEESSQFNTNLLKPVSAVASAVKDPEIAASRYYSAHGKPDEGDNLQQVIITTEICDNATTCVQKDRPCVAKSLPSSEKRENVLPMSQGGKILTNELEPCTEPCDPTGPCASKGAPCTTRKPPSTDPHVPTAQIDIINTSKSTPGPTVPKVTSVKSKLSSKLDPCEEPCDNTGPCASKGRPCAATEHPSSNKKDTETPSSKEPDSQLGDERTISDKTGPALTSQMVTQISSNLDNYVECASNKDASAPKMLQEASKIAKESSSLELRTTEYYGNAAPCAVKGIPCAACKPPSTDRTAYGPTSSKIEPVLAEQEAPDETSKGSRFSAKQAAKHITDDILESMTLSKDAFESEMKTGSASSDKQKTLQETIPLAEEKIYVTEASDEIHKVSSFSAEQAAKYITDDILGSVILSEGAIEPEMKMVRSISSDKPNALQETIPLVEESHDKPENEVVIPKVSTALEPSLREPEKRIDQTGNLPIEQSKISKNEAIEDFTRDDPQISKTNSMEVSKLGGLLSALEEIQPEGLETPIDRSPPREERKTPEVMKANFGALLEEQFTGDFPLDVETKVEVLDAPPPGLHVTTTITRSGNLEVITEGPDGVIETTLNYKDDGIIEVFTQITELSEDTNTKSNEDTTSTAMSDVVPVKKYKHSKQPRKCSAEAQAEFKKAKEELKEKAKAKDSFVSGDTEVALETDTSEFTKETALISSLIIDVKSSDILDTSSNVNDMPFLLTTTDNSTTPMHTDATIQQTSVTATYTKSVGDGIGDEVATLTDDISCKDHETITPTVTEDAALSSPISVAEKTTTEATEKTEMSSETSNISTKDNFTGPAEMETTPQQTSGVENVDKSAGGGTSATPKTMSQEIAGEISEDPQEAIVTSIPSMGELVEETVTPLESVPDTTDRVVESVAKGQVFLPEEGGEPAPQSLQEDEGPEEISLSTEELDGTPTDEAHVSDVEDPASKSTKQAAPSSQKRDCACQSTPPQEQSCQCCECKDIGVSTSTDSETITEENMAIEKLPVKIQESYPSRNGDAPENDVTVDSSKEDRAEAASAEIGKSQGTADELSSLHEESPPKGNTSNDLEQEIPKESALADKDIPSRKGDIDEFQSAHEVLKASDASEKTAGDDAEATDDRSNPTEEEVSNEAGFNGIQDKTSKSQSSEVTENYATAKSQGDHESVSEKKSKETDPNIAGTLSATKTLETPKKLSITKFQSDKSNISPEVTKKTTDDSVSASPTDSKDEKLKTSTITEHPNITSPQKIKSISSTLPKQAATADQSETSEISPVKIDEKPTENRSDQIAQKPSKLISEPSDINKKTSAAKSFGDSPDSAAEKVAKISVQTGRSNESAKSENMQTQKPVQGSTFIRQENLEVASKDISVQSASAGGIEKDDRSEGKPSSGSDTETEKHDKVSKKNGAKPKKSSEVPDSVSKLSDKVIAPNSDGYDCKKPKKKRSQKLENVSCECQGICSCIVCSPGIIAKRKAMTGSLEPPAGTADKVCCCGVSPSLKGHHFQQTQPPMYPGQMHPQMQMPQIYPQPQMMMPMPPQIQQMPVQAYPLIHDQHTPGCRCTACLCNSCTPCPPQYGPPGTEAFLRSTNLATVHGTLPKDRTRISIDDVFKCKANEYAERQKPQEFKRAVHSRHCECVDCLCLPRIKELAHTKEYPVINDEKQIYQVHAMKCACANALNAKKYLAERSRIPIATNSAVGPPKIKPPVTSCTCEKCDCSPCGDPSGKPSEIKTSAPSNVHESQPSSRLANKTSSEMSKMCDCKNCECRVCFKKSPQTDSGQKEPQDGKDQHAGDIQVPVEQDGTQAPISPEKLTVAPGQCDIEKPIPQKKNCCCKDKCTCEVCPIDDKGTTQQVSFFEHPEDCDCTKCFCKNGPGERKMPATESKISEHVSEKEIPAAISKASKKDSSLSHPDDCDCMECVCPKAKSKKREMPSDKELLATTSKMSKNISEKEISPAASKISKKSSSLSHPPDCDCQECVCPKSPTKMPKTDSKLRQKISKELPAVSSKVSKKASITSHPEDCDCIQCSCPKLPTKMSKADSKTRATESKSKISKASINKPSGCTCDVCKCPGKDTTVEQSKITVPCICEICTCPGAEDTKPRDPIQNTMAPIPENIPAADCDCVDCQCNPCADPKKQKPFQTVKSPPTMQPCDCPDCQCSPCADPSKRKEKDVGPVPVVPSQKSAPVVSAVPSEKGTPLVKVETIQPAETTSAHENPPEQTSTVPVKIEHPDDCDCADCICAEEIMKTASDASQKNHIENCNCDICKCESKETLLDQKISKTADKPETPHAEDCICDECRCPDEEVFQTEVAISPREDKSTHPADCICDECVCALEGKHDKGCCCAECRCEDCSRKKDSATHSIDCKCGECLCEECPKKPESADRGLGDNAAATKRPVVIQEKHVKGCRCSECQCEECFYESRPHADECKCGECLCKECHKGSQKADAPAKGMVTVQEKESEKGREKHKRDCSCIECRCIDCYYKREHAGKGQTECKCDVCLCHDCSYKETKPPSKAVEEEKSATKHGSCHCIECVCDICSADANIKKYKIPGADVGEAKALKEESHPEDKIPEPDVGKRECSCIECRCIDCYYKREHAGKGQTECKCDVCLCHDCSYKETKPPSKAVEEEKSATKHGSCHCIECVCDICSADANIKKDKIPGADVGEAKAVKGESHQGDKIPEPDVGEAKATKVESRPEGCTCLTCICIDCYNKNVKTETIKTAGKGDEQLSKLGRNPHCKCIDCICDCCEEETSSADPLTKICHCKYCKCPDCINEKERPLAQDVIESSQPESRPTVQITGDSSSAPVQADAPIAQQFTDPPPFEVPQKNPCDCNACSCVICTVKGTTELVTARTGPGVAERSLLTEPATVEAPPFQVPIRLPCNCTTCFCVVCNKEGGKRQAIDHDLRDIRPKTSALRTQPVTAEAPPFEAPVRLPCNCLDCMCQHGHNEQNMQREIKSSPQPSNQPPLFESGAPQQSAPNFAVTQPETIPERPVSAPVGSRAQSPVHCDCPTCTCPEDMTNILFGKFPDTPREPSHISAHSSRISGKIPQVSAQPSHVTGQRSQISGQPSHMSGKPGKLQTTINCNCITCSCPENMTAILAGKYSDVPIGPTLISGDLSQISGKPIEAPGPHSQFSGQPSHISGKPSNLQTTIKCNCITCCCPENMTDILAGKHSDVPIEPTLKSGDLSQISGKPIEAPGPQSQVSDKPSHISGNISRGSAPHSHISGKVSIMTQEDIIQIVDDNSEADPTQLSGQHSHVSGQPAHIAGQSQNLSDHPSRMSGQPSNVTGHPSQVSGQPYEVSEQVFEKQSRASAKASNISSKKSNKSNQLAEVSSKVSKSSKKPHVACDCPACVCLKCADDTKGKDDKQIGQSASKASKGSRNKKSSELETEAIDMRSNECICPQSPPQPALIDLDISKLDDATLMKKIQTDKQENCECREQIKEIRRALNKIKCACTEAEMKAIKNKPLIKQASAFGQTMSGLKLALSNLQEKCKAKDRMIEAMTGELKMRTSSNTLDNVLNAPTGEVPDYDKAEDVTPFEGSQREPISTNILFTVEEEKETSQKKAFDEKMSKAIETEKTHKKKYRHCKCGKSHKYKEYQNVNLLGFEIVDIRRITEDSIIIKWKPPKNNNIIGYDIFVNGVNKSKVMSGGRTSAMVHSLDLSATIQITIYAVTKCGRCEPPAIAIYEIKPGTV